MKKAISQPCTPHMICRSLDLRISGVILESGRGACDDAFVKFQLANQISASCLP